MTHDDVLARTNALARQHGVLQIQWYGFAESTLTLAASRDPLYYHSLELRFHRPVLVRGRTAFDLDPERGILHACPLDGIGGGLLSSEADRPLRGFVLPADEGEDLVIVAESLTIDDATVYYYRRDPLGPGERLAPWVK
jgi:hypothetical protein